MCRWLLLDGANTDGDSFPAGGGGGAAAASCVTGRPPLRRPPPWHRRHRHRPPSGHRPAAAQMGHRPVARSASGHVSQPSPPTPPGVIQVTDGDRQGGGHRCQITAQRTTAERTTVSVCQSILRLGIEQGIEFVNELQGTHIWDRAKGGVRKENFTVLFQSLVD